MKKVLFLALCFVAVQFSFGQKATNMSMSKVAPNGTYDYMVVDKAPQLKGCESTQCTTTKIISLITENLQKDASAKSSISNISQKEIYIRFTVNKNGSLENIGVRTENAMLKARITQILSKLSGFSAGRHQGNAVNTSYNLFYDASAALVNASSKTKL